MSEKAAVVKLNADGEVMSCAKGLDASECGYVPGAKVCAKCGAMATQVKMNGMGMMPDASVAAPKKKKKMQMSNMVAMDADMEEDEDMMDEEDMDMEMDMEDEDMMDDEDMEDEEESDEKMYSEEDEEDDDSDMYANQAAERRKMRQRRLSTMGYKSADFDDEAFVCAFDRKVYPGGATVCDSCPGGCVSEKGMPALIEIEGI